MTKKFVYMIDFLCQTEITLIVGKNCLKFKVFTRFLFKNPSFSQYFFSQISDLFSLNCQVSGFSRIPGLKATLKV